MESQQVTFPAWVRQDGMLHVDAKIDLPPGPVNVTVEAVVPPIGREDTRKALEAIWAGRKARGVQVRTKEKIDADIDAMRNDDEQRMRDIESLQTRIRENRK